MSDGAVLRIGLQPRAQDGSPTSGDIWRHLATSGDIWRPALAFSSFHDPSYATPHTRSTFATQYESGNGQYMAVLQSS